MKLYICSVCGKSFVPTVNYLYKVKGKYQCNYTHWQEALKNAEREKEKRNAERRRIKNTDMQEMPQKAEES